jgi:hypothetical protein
MDEPQDEVQLLDILKRLLIKERTYCDNGAHRGRFRVSFGQLYLRPSELADLETFLRSG